MDPKEEESKEKNSKTDRKRKGISKNVKIIIHITIY